MKKMMIFTIAALAAAGCRAQTQQEPSTVAVQGTGIVFVQPDMVRLSVTVAETSATSRQAQETVNVRTKAVMTVLKGAKIDDKDIQTASLSLNPQYEWEGQRNVLKGQRAEQRLSIALRKIDALGSLIDQLVQIEGIELGGIGFGVEDNTENYVKARELAYAKARSKAEQYAALSGMRVGRVLSINEGVSNDALVPMSRNSFKLYEAAADMAGATIPTGQQEVTLSVSIVFELER